VRTSAARKFGLSAKRVKKNPFFGYNWWISPFCTVTKTKVIVTLLSLLWLYFHLVLCVAIVTMLIDLNGRTSSSNRILAPLKPSLRLERMLNFDKETKS